MKLSFRNSYVKNAITLVSGTAMSQLLLILISPVLTRLYSPSDFGVYALYMSVVSLLCIFTTARYEIAILFPEDDDDSINIVLLAMCICGLVSLMVLLLIAIIMKYNFFIVQNHSAYIYLVPFHIFFTGLYLTFNSWCIRKKKFKRIAFNKISQSIIVVIINVIIGFVNNKINGLILGILFAQVYAAIYLFVCIFFVDNKKFKNISWHEIFLKAKMYSNFPKYSLPADFVNTLSNQMPVFLLNKFFGAAIIGNFSLTQKILGSPISLIASSILDVFKEKASSDYRTFGNCRESYKNTFKSLFVIAVIPFTISALFSPFIFEIVFGKDWRVAGLYAQLLTPMFFLRFIVSPLTYVVFIVGKQHYDLIWQLCMLFLTSISILSGLLFNSAFISIFFYSISYSIMYIIYLIITYKMSANKLLR